MRRYGVRTAAMSPGMLALLVALGGCQSTTGQFADGLFSAPWGGMRPATPGDSLTIARVRGAAVTSPAEPLQPEPGNVGPAEEAPRATLANPDAALRGIPSYRPGGEARPLDSLTPPAAEPGPRRGAAVRPRGSSSPPPPPRRADGQVVLTPQGPVVTSGGTDRVQSFTTPGGGSGIITRDGPNATVIGPDGRVQTVPAPR